MMVFVIVIVLAWVALPFVPALLELRHRRDAHPLTLSNRYREDLRLNEDRERHEVVIPCGRALVGTVSAEGTLRLSVDCAFERLHAPIVWFGEEVERDATPPGDCLSFEPPPQAELAANRFLVRGDLVVPAHTLVESDLVVTGGLYLEEGVVLKGSAKSHGQVTLGPNVDVHGSLFSKSNLYVGEGSRIDGVVAADGELVLSAGSVVGMPEAETTATGRRVRAALGACVHGTVWALEEGRVTAD